MSDAGRISVSLVYAEPERVFTVALELPAGASVGDAVARSNVRVVRPDIDINEDRIGVFARKVTFRTSLHDGDRVELYRPLKLDPKEARRRRAGATRSQNT